MRSGWILAVLSGLFLALFSAYPQLKLFYNEGGKWNGHYAYNDIDEVAYAAYLKALMDGRPRRNDPYTGQDDKPGAEQPESLFSIQFAAPYAVALPARLLGVSAPTAMIACGIVSAFLSALLLFFLIKEVTGSDLAGLAGSLLVLCGGALAAGEGAIGEILGTGIAYPYFPFLRRYLPAVPFAAFAALLFCVWRWFQAERPLKRAVCSALAFVLFSFLVFSYFYIWTTAAAWLVCIGVVWLVFRPGKWKADLKGLAVFAVTLLVPLVIYALMLSWRAASLDKVQLLVYSRSLDLTRFPEYVAGAALVIFVVGVMTRRLDTGSRSALFALSLALVPFVIFNQQVITGRSLQPIHYQVFIGNYVAGLALVLTAFLFAKGRSGSEPVALKAIYASLATLAVVWGFIECHYTVRVLDQANVLRDLQVPLAEKLVKYGHGSEDPYRTTIFSLSNIQADDSPTLAPQAVLWSRHQHIFAGLTWQESKERYYRYLYYQSLDEKWLETRLRRGDFVSIIALFGWGRQSNRLTVAAEPLTGREITEEVRRYGDYIRNFSGKQAYSPGLTFVTYPKGWNPDLTNLEKWYRIGEPEDSGGHVLRKLEPLSGEEH